MCLLADVADRSGDATISGSVEEVLDPSGERFGESLVHVRVCLEPCVCRVAHISELDEDGRAGGEVESREVVADAVPVVSIVGRRRQNVAFHQCFVDVVRQSQGSRESRVWVPKTRSCGDAVFVDGAAEDLVPA